MIERISQENLEKIINNEIEEESKCVIKFYSNGCHYCHALKDHYETIAGDTEGVYFLAFNVDDAVGDIEDKLGFQGVPSFCFVETGQAPTITFMSEPENPNDTTWYNKSDIREFIEKNAAPFGQSEFK
tara:strand:- start:398 stop:781 length:384 start_codon:yes stop_codon:yes gene_type:complete